MPSKSVTLDDSQYKYILETMEDEAFSERLREVVDHGIEFEERGSDVL